jgi:hypothetical protein
MRKTLLLLPLLCLSSVLFSQELVGTTGSTIKNSEVEIAYAIGEIGIHTISSTENIATQGLLQPNIRIINNDCADILKSIIFYPNPARNELRLSTQYLGITHYQIFASDGKLVASEPFTYNPINLTKLSSGVYVIRLFVSCDNGYRAIKFMKQ